MKGEIGHLYLLSNPALGGIIKIGHTKKVEAELRAAELSSTTAIPLPFSVECSWLVEHPSAWESRIHRRLVACRVSKDREFFRITPDEAERHINSMLYGTEDPSKALIYQLKSLAELYRKHPDSFRRSEELVAKIEAFLLSEQPA